MQHRRLSLSLLVLGAAAFTACAGDSTGPEMIGPGSNASLVPNENQLAAWFEHASPAALAIGGAVFADHDEENNRLLFGVMNENAARGVATALEHLGIPRGSFAIVETEPIYQVATLRDEFDPTQAGIQIHFGQFVCSLGFNAGTGIDRSFVTASHCTNRQGGVEGTQYFQPLSSVDGTVIATEVDDPQYRRNLDSRCPRGKKCRYSDAARALYSETQSSTLGAIAKTSGFNNGSLTVTGSFTITAHDATTDDFDNGIEIDKVGRTTGWTRGTVSGSCVDTGVSGTNIVQLCQTFVSFSSPIVGGGDSGSGVFRQTGANSAELVGILWGGSSDNKLFVFSPLKNVFQELGTLTVR